MNKEELDARLNTVLKALSVFRQWRDGDYSFADALCELHVLGYSIPHATEILTTNVK